MDGIKKENLSLKLFIVLLRASRAIADCNERKIKTFGVNKTEFAVLELLYHKGEQPIQKIGKKVLLSSGSITYVVDKLEQKGYLQRKYSAKDRRVIYAVITDVGKAFIEEIFPENEEAIEELLSVLTEKEKESLIKKLKIVGHHAEKQA
ncbi:MarR family winged helix-turn-helix transcriptional regulator [Alkalihalobacillus pseudalcaliphilus]|uniref:MarR family winged helix-turn-helix transcriptional regulator n=1 Tax=Alkalihalobacillus pseudalcaliphilus TaxID=79884 RepID=UPI00064D9C34|nr:MarR family transcriptional regulator [Alkalihalobacillus pseudalcaliphilus]KMK78158.1 transcriptional regulator [Alkalihalobacillus pseudalcaliphilus]